MIKPLLITLILIPLYTWGLSKSTDRVLVVPRPVFRHLTDVRQDVSRILRYPSSGLSVSLRGRLLSKIKHERYHFTDGTGVITAYIRDLFMPMTGIPIHKDVEIDATVHVDVGGRPELRVSRIHFVAPYETTRRGVLRFRVRQQDPSSPSGYGSKDYYYHYDDYNHYP